MKLRKLKNFLIILPLLIGGLYLLSVVFPLCDCLFGFSLVLLPVFLIVLLFFQIIKVFKKFLPFRKLTLIKILENFSLFLLFLGLSVIVGWVLLWMGPPVFINCFYSSVVAYNMVKDFVGDKIDYYCQSCRKVQIRNKELDEINSLECRCCFCFRKHFLFSMKDCFGCYLVED